MDQDKIVLEMVSDILIKLPLTVENMEGVSNEYVATEIVTLRSFMSGPIWAALAKATEGQNFISWNFHIMSSFVYI